MPQPNDLSRSLVALDQDSTIIAVVELSQSSWLVAGVLPGIERQPRERTDTELSRVYSVSSSNGGIATKSSTRRPPVSRREHSESSGGASTAPRNQVAVG